MESWSLWLEKEYFKFSCGHFLIFPDGSKERIHGHNYQVKVRIHGDLSDRGLVLDFIQVKPHIRRLCDQLDEHFLLPGEHPDLLWQERDDGHTEFAYKDCRYLLPSEEVIVLPINNSSVENISAWFGRELKRRLREAFPEVRLHVIEVAVAETAGQYGVFRMEGDA